MKEYSELIGVIGAILAILLIGAFFSPTFEEQKSFWMLFINIVIVIAAFGVLITLAAIGFSSFALYGAVFTAIVLFVFGIEGVLLVIGMTYLIWGFIFSFETLLVAHKVASAEEWFKARYTYESFYKEYVAFYPMLMFVYTVIEVLPTLLDFQKPKRFEPDEILKRMQEILR
ncbi:MAG: hypothetical protein JXQ77_02060 [Campylobacterales bacterium]|nr:hypothetical protein [Campylobacterales bacterium]